MSFKDIFPTFSSSWNFQEKNPGLSRRRGNPVTWTEAAMFTPAHLPASCDRTFPSTITYTYPTYVVRKKYGTHHTFLAYQATGPQMTTSIKAGDEALILRRQHGTLIHVCQSFIEKNAPYCT